MPIDYDQLPNFAGFDGHTERIPTVWHGIEDPFRQPTIPLEVLEYVTETGNEILRGITGGHAYAGYMDLQKKQGRFMLYP